MKKRIFKNFNAGKLILVSWSIILVLVDIKFLQKVVANRAALDSSTYNAEIVVFCLAFITALIPALVTIEYISLQEDKISLHLMFIPICTMVVEKGAKLNILCGEAFSSTGSMYKFMHISQYSVDAQVHDDLVDMTGEYIDIIFGKKRGTSLKFKANKKYYDAIISFYDCEVNNSEVFM